MTGSTIRNSPEKGARQAIETLLDRRSAGATICPSEAARLLAAKGDWRGMMDEVHIAVDAMVEDKHIELSWKGEPLSARLGPYRIARVAER